MHEQSYDRNCRKRVGVEENKKNMVLAGRQGRVIKKGTKRENVLLLCLVSSEGPLSG